MASPKPLSSSIYGAFYLPVVSLAVITGFTFSVILPAALIFLIPAMESAFSTSLPHLWDAFLGWVTPPCLFVLLNGIIVVLTASSGMFSSSKSGSGSDFYTNLLGKMETSQNESSGVVMVDSSVADPDTNLPIKMKNLQPKSSAALMEETPASVWLRPANSRGMACEVFRAHADLEEECEFFEIDEEEEDDDGKSSKLSKVCIEGRSRPFTCTESRIEEEEEEEEEGNGSDDDEERPSRLSKLAMVNKSFSFACREEEGVCVKMKGSSEPSSPQFATPSKNNGIRRSLSIDSASLQDDQAPSPSPETLSDEAFRKRIEDFISKMNAQLRSEPK